MGCSFGVRALTRRVLPPGRSLEPRSDARPRGMTVLPAARRADRIRLTGPAVTFFSRVLRCAQNFGPARTLACPEQLREAKLSNGPRKAPQLTGPAVTPFTKHPGHQAKATVLRLPVSSSDGE